jgi:hypothetical protein
MIVRRVSSVLLGLALAPTLAPAQTAAPGRAGVELKSSAEALPSSGVRYDSAGRRDPFLNVALLKRTERDDEEESRGQAPPGISGMYIAQVKLTGISDRQGARTAVFEGTDKRAYFLQAGDKLFDGFLKGIERDSVSLLRQTKLKSGKIISQEVTKRLRQP